MKTFSYINREHPLLIAALNASAIAGVAQIAAQHYLHTCNANIAALTAIVFAASVFWLAAIHTSPNAKARRYGIQLETAAIAGLKHLIPRSWALKTGVKSNGGGDIDVVLHTGQVYAIEIKAYQGLTIRRDQLAKMNGSTLNKDPIEQAIRAAQTVGGLPILWMPAARQKNAFHHQGVLVVNGDVRFLVDTLAGDGA